MAPADLRDELSCSVCLNIYKDPTTLRCGHSCCRVCIDCVVQSQEGAGGYSCSECGEEIQYFCYTHFHLPVPAVQSLLEHEASVCDNHCEFAFKNIISTHNSMESSSPGVTYCMDGVFKGHQVEPLEGASEKQKKKLRNTLKKLTSEREEADKRVQKLQESRRKTQEKATEVIDRVTALFRDIQRQLEDLKKTVLRDISRWEKESSQMYSDQIQQLEIRKNELSKKMHHIEELCNITDPLTVSQESDPDDFCDMEKRNNEDTEREDEELHHTGDLDEGLITVTLYKRLADTWSSFKKKIFADIILDVDTAGHRLAVSRDLKTLSFSAKGEDYPEAAERFEHSQVISRHSFSSGRHYWEVESSSSGSWVVGVCYPSIDRRGEWSFIGDNHKSWGLCACYNQYSVMHGSTESEIQHSFSCCRIGIFLDYDAGQLSLYELCDPIRHLHTFTATFTEPLNAAFYVWDAWLTVRD